MSSLLLTSTLNPMFLTGDTPKHNLCQLHVVLLAVTNWQGHAVKNCHVVGVTGLSKQKIPFVCFLESIHKTLLQPDLQTPMFPWHAPGASRRAALGKRFGF